ncbi:hypothetical protein OG906_38695 (plasmid) [Streptomyces sp. NBC_01426]|uniref:hypothetical protein n=1 Tax=Streptomyces sp. NBC_01426 TaxID=2975866 RepID=UPI002E2FB40C|nr:hypothetical protein [Streptomyces sp. NBC_01426]
MLDHTEFEWVPADATPVLLYPGFTSDDALVEPGEITAAVYNGSDGIALHGARDEVLALLLRLADAVRNAPPVPTTEACIAASTDPSTWVPGPLTESLAPSTRAWPLCDSETPSPSRPTPAWPPVPTASTPSTSTGR